MRLLKKADAEPVIVIISGSCCIPGMAPLDEQARRIAEQAVKESGVRARVEVIPAVAAFSGGTKGLISELMAEFGQSGRIGLPAVLLGGKVVSKGVPKADDIKSALLGAKKGDTHE